MKLMRLADLLVDPTPVPEPAQFSGPAYSVAMGAAQTSKGTTALIRMDAGVCGNWHTHADGQLIHVVDGGGVIGRRGDAPLRLAPGDLVWIEPGEEHFHGALDDTHLAQIAVSFGPITWLESST
jgi:quercetin dioxygenase-like cupin family protein